MNEKTNKRILLFSTAYLPLVGGAELALKEITDRIQGVDFDLITARLGKELSSQERLGRMNVFRVGWPISYAHYLITKALLPIWGFFKALQLTRTRGSYDAIFALQASQGAGAAWLYKIFHPKVPFIINVQEGKELQHQFFFVRWSRQLMLLTADKITVISSYLRDVVARCGVARHDIIVIPNGVDTERFQVEVDEEARQQLRQRFGLTPHDKVIVSASRLVPKNGLHYLIGALPQLPGYKLVLLGEGESKDALATYARQLGVSDRVIFGGTIAHADLPRHLHMADVFARTPQSEGFGTAFIEAMAAGVPLVTAAVAGGAVGGIADFVEHGRTGMIAKDQSPSAIAKAVMALEQSDVRQAIILQAADLVRSRYDWRIIARQYQALFESLPAHRLQRLLVITQKVDMNDDLLGFFHTWLTELAKRVEHLSVITLFEGKHDLSANVTVLSLGKEHGASRWLRLIRFYKYLWRYSAHADRIFAHMSPIFVVASWPLAALRRTPIWLWYVHRSVTWRLRLAVLLSQKILTVSPESLRLSSSKIILTGHGIDNQYFQPSTPIAQHDKVFEIISVNRLSPIKDLETSIKAAAILRDRGIRFHITLIGGPIMPVDFAYEQTLRALIKEKNLDMITFAGPVPYRDLMKYYEHVDLAVNLAPTGGLDKVVFEAMACGLPVLVANQSFRRDLNPYQDVLLFEHHNPVDLAAKIITMIESDRMRIGTDLRQRVVTHHSVAHIAELITSSL